MNNKFNSVSVINETHKYKFSNKDSIVNTLTWDYETKCIDLGEFKTFFQCFIPKYIHQHEINSKVFIILVSYASLNKSKIKKETLLKLAIACNERIVGEKMTEEEMIIFVDKAFEDRNTFKPKDNKAVRYIMNPYHEFDINVMTSETVRLRKISDYKDMIELATNWDFDVDGSPTQENLGLKLGYSRRTMIRKFKDKEGLAEFFVIWDELKADYLSKFYTTNSKKGKKQTTVNIRKKDVKVKREKGINKKRIYKSEVKIETKRKVFTNYLKPKEEKKQIEKIEKPVENHILLIRRYGMCQRE